jgi:hypothetical protein
MIVISILAIYGIAFAIKEADGPWDLISKWRNWMVRLPFIGVQFYKLIDCWYCTGWWSAIIVYLLSEQSYKLTQALLWGFCGGAACLIIHAAISRLYRE